MSDVKEKVAAGDAAKSAKAKDSAKKPVRKAAAKAAPKVSFEIQFAGRELTTDAVFVQVKDAWVKGMKKKASDMKAVQIYVKPEECAAYYVINGDVSGKVDL